MPIYCHQMPEWECNPVTSFGRYAYEEIRDTEGYVTKHTDQQQQLQCVCGITNGHVGTHVRAPVKILSFPAYCRYRACLKLIASGLSPRREVMSARGAVEVECSQTRLLFCRFKFQHPGIDDFALKDNIRSKYTIASWDTVDKREENKFFSNTFTRFEQIIFFKKIPKML